MAVTSYIYLNVQGVSVCGADDVGSAEIQKQLNRSKTLPGMA